MELSITNYVLMAVVGRFQMCPTCHLFVSFCDCIVILKFQSSLFSKFNLVTGDISKKSAGKPTAFTGQTSTRPDSR